MYISIKYVSLIFITLFAKNYFGQSESQITDTCKVQIPNWINLSCGGSGDWRVHSTCAILEFTIQVYDRWGNKMHQQDSLGTYHTINWDLKKRNIGDGVYFYIAKCKVRREEFAEEMELKGNVQLMR